jgi:hypothetical protein
MVQVIEAGTPRGPSFLQQLGAGANSVLEAYNEQKQLQGQKQAIAQRFPELAGLPPELQKIGMAEMLKQQGKEKLFNQKQGYLDQLFGGQGQGQQQGRGQEEDVVRKLQQGSQENPQGMDQGFDPSQIPDEVIARAAAVDPNIARSLQHAKDVALREKSAGKTREFEREKFEYKKGSEKEKMARSEAEAITKPLMLELQQARKNIPLQEQAIEDIKTAAPQVGALDYLADVTGFEPLRSAEGAKLKTSIKDYFLSDLSRVGSRPNQWIEAQLLDALPKIGRSTEANLVTAEGLKFKLDLAKKRVEIIDELVQQDQEKHGYVKPDIDSRASKLLKPYVEQSKKSLIDNITAIKRKHKSLDKEAKAGKYIKMISPQGEVYEILPSDMKEAEEHGFIRQ